MIAPRVQLRKMMVLVALVAVSISGGRLAARCASRFIEYRRIAGECRAIEARMRRDIAAVPFRCYTDGRRRQLACSARMALEYERAAWQLWSKPAQSAVVQ
jgi:hypothetical protein